MIDFQLSTIALGVLSSFVAGILSLIPYLGATDLRRNITAIVVLIVGSFVYGGFVYTSFSAFMEFFLSVAVYALVTYKFFLQTIVFQPLQAKLTQNPKYAAKMSQLQ